jgi:hypothetical protein
MNSHTSMSVNHMKEGQSKCGNGLQTEEHVFRDCILYEDERATVVNMLVSPNTRTKNICARRLLFHKYNP